jgi:beta-lactam-binding protein with PASTA domain
MRLSRKGPWSVLLVLAASLTLAAAAAAVTTPDVTHRSYSTAIATLSKAHLCFRVYMLNSIANKGKLIKVIRQSPEPGAQVPRWSVVALTVAFADLPAFSMRITGDYPCRRFRPRVVRG